MTRAVAEFEIQRILAIVPWIVAHPGSSKREIAERFGIAVEQLDADLDLVLMIGVPPYTPGDYIDVEIDEDDDGEYVTLRMAESFRRPVRLSPSEGLAVLAAGRALLAVRGSEPDGPLARALDKLAAALDYPELVVDIATPAFLDEARQAAARGVQIEIEYWSSGRDDLTVRRVDPYSVFFAQGEWYLNGYCHRAHDERLFRVDRIRQLRATDVHFDVDGATAAPQAVYRPRPDDLRVTLRIDESAAWVAEQYPVEQVESAPDGTLRVVVAVSEPAFLERLLLRLGPSASVTEPEHSGLSARRAAQRVLDRYGAGPAN